jgi:hypothetical protein
MSLHPPPHGAPLLERRAILAALAGWTAAALWSRDSWADSGDWKQVSQDSGVTIWNRSEADRNLPVFKGTGRVDASIFEILAVLNDTSRHTEWMANCMKAQVLKQINEFDRILYNRTDSPWPVSDRDVVVSATVTGSMAKREVVSAFSSISSGLQPPIDGVVRMPRLKGFYRLAAEDERRTRVTYQIDADPGGSLPDWVAERATRRLPLDTILGLRKQTAKMRGKYPEFLQKYDPAHGGAIPPRFLEA